MAVMAVRTIAGQAPPAVDEEAVASALGTALRTLRKAQGLTLRQLADRCGLSQPFLSQLENGKAMPSLIALHNVAQALGATAHGLLQPQRKPQVSLIRRGEGEVYELTEGATTRFLTRGRSQLIDPSEVNFEPGVRTENAGHAGEEMLFVLEGRLQVDLEGFGSVELTPGDIYLYPATVPHVMSTNEHQTCRVLIITSPPSF